MSATQRPRELFRAALVPEVRDAWDAVEGIDESLAAAHRRAVPPAPCRAPTLERHMLSIATRVATAGPDTAAIDGLDHPGIALADACVAGDPPALQAFHNVHIRDIEHAIGRTRAPAWLVDDARQIVLAKLLPPGGKLASYGGRGSLRNWVRAVTVRETISVLRASPHRDVETDDAFDPAASGDVELAFVKHAHRTQFRTALRATFAALDPEDRAVLRYRFVDGLTLDQLAAVLGVHRATAARWLARLREDLLRGIRRRMCDELGIDKGEFDSLVQLVRSNLEITMGGLLRDEST